MFFEKTYKWLLTSKFGRFMTKPREWLNPVKQEEALLKSISDFAEELLQENGLEVIAVKDYHKPFPGLIIHQHLEHANTICCRRFELRTPENVTYVMDVIVNFTVMRFTEVSLRRNTSLLILGLDSTLIMKRTSYTNLLSKTKENIIDYIRHIKEKDQTVKSVRGVVKRIREKELQAHE